MKKKALLLRDSAHESIEVDFISSSVFFFILLSLLLEMKELEDYCRIKLFFLY